MQQRSLLCLLATFLAFSGPAQAQAPAGLSLQQAVAMALSGNGNIEVARAQLEAARGAVQQEQGSFDPVWTLQAARARESSRLAAADQAALAAQGIGLRDTRSDTVTTELAFTRRLPQGVQAIVEAGQAHVRDDALATQGRSPQATGVLRFRLVVPLARDSGDAVQAPLRARTAEAAAARAELAQAAARAVLATALAYWDRVATGERLAIAQAGERRSADLLEELNKLVQADEVPRAELRLAQAALNERRAARIAAEQAAQESRRALGRLLGLPATALAGLAAPADRFPPPTPAAVTAPLRSDALGAMALARRADLLALRQRREAALLRLDAARNQERHRLDLLLGATRQSLSDRGGPLDYAAAFGPGAGPGLSVGLAWSAPLGNNTAQGQLRQQLAQLEAIDTQAQELAQDVASRVDTAAWALARAAQQLEQAEQAATAWAAGVESERTKRRLGLSTLVDVVNVEDRYQAARLAVVQARAAFAAAIAQLRFEAGGLVTADGDGHRAEVAALLDPEVR